jgi:hypothetical protein
MMDVEATDTLNSPVIFTTASIHRSKQCTVLHPYVELLRVHQKVEQMSKCLTFIQAIGKQENSEIV